MSGLGKSVLSCVVFSENIFIYSLKSFLVNQQNIAEILLRNRCYYYHSIMFGTYWVRIVHRCSNCNRVRSDICNVLSRQWSILCPARIHNGRVRRSYILVQQHTYDIHLLGSGLCLEDTRILHCHSSRSLYRLDILKLKYNKYIRYYFKALQRNTMTKHFIYRVCKRSNDYFVPNIYDKK